MKFLGCLLAALTLLCGCNSAIGPTQADGADCNFSLAATACGATSFCDPGEPSPTTGYLRQRAYGASRDKTHVVGTCKPKGAVGAECLGKEQCASGTCVHASAAPPLGAKGACR